MFGAEFLQERKLTSKVRGAVETLVDAGKSQVGDLVETPQSVEHSDPDPSAGDIGTLCTHLVLDRIDKPDDVLLRNRPALGCGADPTGQLGGFERLTAAVTLGDDQANFFEALVRRETVRAAQALPASANCRALLGDTRVDDFGVFFVTGRAAHTCTITELPTQAIAVRQIISARSARQHQLLPGRQRRSSVEGDQTRQVGIDVGRRHS